MTVADLFMLVVLVLAGAAALLVVTARNVVHAALYLVIALLGGAGAFLLVGAEFLAWTQVLVYVGAVIVLILFGLMLTRAPIGPMPEDNENKRFAVVISVALFGFLMVASYASFGGEQLPLNVTTTVALAEQLYVQWAFPLIVLGFLLTVSLVGAIILARQDEGEGPDPFEEMGRPELQEPGRSDVTAEAAPAQGEEVSSR